MRGTGRFRPVPANRPRRVDNAAMPRTILALLLFAGLAVAAEPHPRAVATDAYLLETGGSAYGVFAESAAGGVNGWVDVRLLAWYPSLHGSGNDDGGGDFDLRSDFGLKDNEWTLVPQVTLNWWLFGVRLDYYEVEFSGSGSLSRTIEFGGVSFTAGTPVDSTARIQNFRSLGFLRFLDLDNVRLCGLLGFSYYDYRATIRSTLGTGTVDGIVPAPVVGALVQARFAQLLLEAEVSGFYVDFSGIEASVVDITVSAAWNFLKFGEVRAGYRYARFDGRVDDTSVDVRLDGFFLAVGFVF